MTLTLPFFDSSAFNFSDASHYTTEKNYKTPNFIASCSGGLIDRCQDATERDGKTGWEEREQKRGEREGLIVDAIGNLGGVSAKAQCALMPLPLGLLLAAVLLNCGVWGH
uniref:Uncharacterized protein n=1 Tax=Fagus sylvatica TaxID=28930 RepID=A0A2N9HTZ4_FAGSY